MGAYIKTDNPRKDIRTITNACSQFWSILTLLTINKMHALIDEHNLSDKIKCISTIYDSVYYLVDDDPVIIKWLNDHLIAVMTKDFMENQTIKNEATSELGYDWATMHQIKNNASITDVKSVLAQLHS